MYYIVYKTTNLLNEKFYIGIHKTKDLKDDYLGSGIALKKAIKKHGKENFKREILQFCSSQEELWKVEKEIVTICNESYNMKNGGRGGFDHIDTSGNNNPMRNPEIVRKHIENKRKNNSFHTPKFIQHVRNMTEIAKTKNTGNKRSQEFKNFVKDHSTKMWQENKEKFRDCMASTFRVISPSKEEYVTNRLSDFCKEKKLPYVTLWKTSKTGKTANRGPAKGWLCILL